MGSEDGLSQVLSPDISPYQSWVKEQAGVLSRSFNKELRGGPLVKFLMFFSPHINRYDLEGFRELYAQCDVFSPEQFGWSDQMEKIYHIVSRREMAPWQILIEERTDVFHHWGDFFKEKLQIVYDIGQEKHFISFDEPAGSKLSYQIYLQQLMPFFNFQTAWEWSVLVKKKPFNEVVKEFDSRQDAFFRLQISREQRAIQRVAPALAKRFRLDPALRAKGEVIVLMQWGSLHRVFGDIFTQAGVPAQSFFSPKESESSPLLANRYMSKKRAGELVPQVETAKVFSNRILTALFTRHFEEMAVPTYFGQRYFEKFISRISLEEVTR